MYHALLDFRVGITGFDGLGESRQVVHAADEDVLNAPVFQFIEHGQPEFRRLMFADPHPQDILAAVKINTDYHVNGFVDNMPLPA